MSPSTLPRQQGSMLVIAIFVIVVISLLGLTILRLTTTAAQSLVTEVYGLRALTAAQTGINRLLLQELPHAGAADTRQCINGNSMAATTINLRVAGLENCSYTIECKHSVQDVTIAGLARDFVMLRSLGRCSADGFIVSRRIEVEALR